MVSYARSLGLDVSELLRANGVDRNLLGDPDYRVPESSRTRLWLEVPPLSGDSFFGLHVPTHASIGAFDVLDYALCYSGTVREALGRLVTFHRLLSDAIAIDVVERAGVAHVRRKVTSTPPHEQDAVLAFICLRLREISGSDIRPRRASFEHAAPPSMAEHEKLFRCPLRFGLPLSELELATVDLDRPVLQARPALAAVLDRHARDILARLPSETGYTHRVRHAVAQALQKGAPSLEAIAHTMRASPRTVQRRLREEGTALREVVDDVRRELAMRYLSLPSLSVTEVAFLLAFTDASSFRRAFKRWTGKSPPSQAGTPSDQADEPSPTVE